MSDIQETVEWLFSVVDEWDKRRCYADGYANGYGSCLCQLRHLLAEGVKVDFALEALRAYWLGPLLVWDGVGVGYPPAPPWLGVTENERL